MSETLNTLELLWQWAQIVVVFMLGLLGWNIRTKSQRLADLEKDKADKDDMNGAFKELRESISHGFDKTHEDIRSLHSRIDGIKDK